MCIVGLSFIEGAIRSTKACDRLIERIISSTLFIGSALLLIVVGLIKSLLIQHHPVLGQFAPVGAVEPLTVFLVLKSFAVGCSAMTGVEAISN